ncbi:FlgN protein [Clostridium putrefaciens]|uniref:FlgN protein n=1 Tax=Clostridium putrefaciens TaxID=99675 RepID=A0A381J8Q2_9CLOT|nr:flagellar protein FlgN [Clostridium putrefaciens]SUY47505.1 FlgN protein [Clostridium putrefaciens]
MKIELKDIINEESICLKDLLNLLEKQHEYILKDEVFKLEAIVEHIENCNKTIAKAEVKRRAVTKGRAMSEIIKELNDEELEDSYRDIKGFVESLVLQKDFNESLLKQKIGYTTKMLNIINPKRQNTTYNSLGRVGK